MTPERIAGLVGELSKVITTDESHAEDASDYKLDSTNATALLTAFAEEIAQDKDARYQITWDKDGKRIATRLAEHEARGTCATCKWRDKQRCFNAASPMAGRAAPKTFGCTLHEPTEARSNG